MKVKFAVDPDDFTIEFVAGNETFWNQFGDNEPDIYDLDRLVTMPDYDHSAYEGKFVTNDVYTREQQRLVVSEKTFDILQDLNPDEQQSILLDIVIAGLGSLDNMIIYATAYDPNEYRLIKSM